MTPPWLLRRSSMLRIYQHGEAAPWWMGLAWYDHYRDIRIAMPIPLNILVGLGRRFYQWLRNPWSKIRTRAEQRCFEKGYRAGRYERDVLEKVS
jgi:hypothetical protein